MEELEKMINELEKYCVDNGIDFVFGASTKDEQETIVKSSAGSNNILIISSRLLFSDL